MTRVIVIGAGPAGLAATDAALRAGAEVVLLDSAPQLGGQFWRHPAEDGGGTGRPVLQHNWGTFSDLSTTIGDHPDCRIIALAQVWAIDASTDTVQVHAAVGAADGPRRELITTTGDALVLATGAHDHTLPFPGWDLPGVFTGGAAQALAKADRVPVGDRVIVAGSGPFLLPVTASLLQVDAEVIAVHEAAGRRRLAAGWVPYAPWLLDKGGELGGYLGTQARHRVPYRTSSAVIAAHGDDRVIAATVARLDAQWQPVPGTEQIVACDAICVSHGFTPRLELAIAAGCRITESGFVAVDADQQTSVPSVFGAGEITAIAGSDAALAEGEIAGFVAAGGAAGSPELASARRRRSRYARIGAGLSRAHRVGRDWTGWLTGDTVICRCEEVDYQRLGEVRDATGARGLRSLRLTTRAGLGPCQGRICGPVVQSILSDRQPMLDDASMHRRPIAAPIRFAELADDQFEQESER